MILAAYYHTILAILFAALAVVLIGVILLQRGKGVGLAGAFGGTGGGAAFGAKTGDVLTWATIALAVFLLTCTVFLNYVFIPGGPGLTADTPAEMAAEATAETTSLAPPATDEGAAAPAVDTEAKTPATTTDQPADSTAEPVASPDAEAPSEAPAGESEPSSNDAG